MKRITAFLLLLILFQFSAYASDTLHVVTHNKMTVVTNPAKGNNPYPAWGVFPAKNYPVRRIILHVTLGCPENLRVADWDYLDKITIRRIGGIKGDSKDFEIARMLTPYGGTFGKEWNFKWSVDVTDFSMLLRDSVEIEYNHSGYEDNKDRGWAVTLDFEIIKGTPLLEPISITKIYDGEFQYGDSLNSIEKNLPPVPFTADKKGYITRLRINQTGHGMNEDDGCGEFCSKKRYIYFDGSLVNTKSLWMECGDNPLYPQAGTWIFDRANWCPGYLVIPDIYDFRVTPGKLHIADVNMEPYSRGKTQAVESVNAYLIHYKKPESRYDASVEEVIVPSSKQVHSRKNPSSHSPRIVIKNSGYETLKSLLISYGTEGFKKKEYSWKGELPFGASAEVILPGAIEAAEGNNLFNVSISKPNGYKDEYGDDNHYISPFSKAPVIEKEFIVFLQTNSQPRQNAWFVKNSKGEILFKRDFHTLEPNKIYKDTVKLTAGSFDFVFEDTAGDGLEFWYNTAGGRGRLFLLNKKGELLKGFDSDFGSGAYYSFYASDDASSSSSGEPVVGLFPTRTLGRTRLDYFSSAPKDITVQITAENGSLVEEHKYSEVKEAVMEYDLSYRTPQRYYLKLLIGGEVKFNKRIRVMDKL